jgi:hypothetical protein
MKFPHTALIIYQSIISIYQNLHLRTNEEENRVNILLEEMFNIYNF